MGDAGGEGWAFCVFAAFCGGDAEVSVYFGGEFFGGFLYSAFNAVVHAGCWFVSGGRFVESAGGFEVFFVAGCGESADVEGVVGGVLVDEVFDDGLSVVAVERTAASSVSDCVAHDGFPLVWGSLLIYRVMG